MDRKTIAGLAFFLLLLKHAATVSAGELENDRADLRATLIQTPIRLDGVLSEEVWKRAQVVDTFRQREPNEGEPASERTEVRILMDRKYLYVGVICYDSEPEKIIAKEMERDSDLERDDNFALVLDTFFDQRSGFLFATNPNGAKFDAQLGFGRERMDPNWDGIWDVRAAITEEGWSAEFLIPFRTLRFKEENVQRWGINFRRMIARKNEEDLWKAWRRNDGLLQLTQAGVLELSSSVERGHHIELMPYMSGGFEKGYPGYGYETGRTGKTGLDVKYGLTPTLTLDLTLNTDFAQVEADQVRINLTRFNLFYPEKRDFFLESASNFQFGSEHRAMAFYSRRIGLTRTREPVPILAGVRLSGKAGRYDVGALTIQTGKHEEMESTNYTVLRFKRNVLRQSYVGMIYTQKTPAETTSVNRVAGVDFRFVTDRFLGNKNFVVAGYAMKSFTPGNAPQTHALNFFVDYPNDLIDMFLFFGEVGDRFNPEVGFVRRKGLRSYGGSFRFMPRPNIRQVRKFHFAFRVFSNYTFSGVLDSRMMMFRPFGIIFQSGDVVEVDIERNFDFFPQDFPLFGEVYVRAGKYEATSYQVKVETNQSRFFSIEAAYRWGGFYSGTHRKTELETALRFSKYLSVAGGMNYTDAQLPEGSFVAWEWFTRLQFAFTTRLSGFIFLQWNNEDDETILNFRLRWIPRLGSDFYLVYNEVEDTRLGRFQPKHRVVLAKFTYWWGI